MENYAETSVKIADIRVGDVVNNLDGQNWKVTYIDTDTDNGFTRYIIGLNNNGELFAIDLLPTASLTYRKIIALDETA